MKIRKGFISNSSSSSFVITNTGNTAKHLVDFIEENPQLIEEFCDLYGYDYTQEELLDSATGNYSDMVFEPGKPTEVVFGDEEGTLVGLVFDYILRDGGKSDNFTWYFKDLLR